MNRRYIFALRKDSAHTRKGVNFARLVEYYLGALFTRFMQYLGEETGGNYMCEHCDILREVLTELTGAKVAAVIMTRTAARLHGTDSDQFSRNFIVVTA
jgi:hypothetical protein